MPVKIVCEKTGETVTFKFVKGPSRVRCPSCGFGHFLDELVVNVPPGGQAEPPTLRSEPIAVDGQRSDPARGILHKEWLLPERGGLDGVKLARMARQALENARRVCEWLADWKLSGKGGAGSWPRAGRKAASSRVARFLYLCGVGRGSRIEVKVVRDPQAPGARRLRVEGLIRPENRISRITRLFYVLLLLATLGLWGFIGYHYYATGSKAGGLVAPELAVEWAKHVPEFVPEELRPHVAAGAAALAPLVVMALVAIAVGITTRISGAHDLGPIESHSVADAFTPAFEKMLVKNWSAKAEEL